MFHLRKAKQNKTNLPANKNTQKPTNLQQFSVKGYYQMKKRHFILTASFTS